MQPLARLADALGEDGFYIHVDVLGIHGKGQRARAHFLEHMGKGRHDGIRVGLGNDILLAQHRGVRNGAENVLLGQPLIKGDGRVEIVYRAIGGLFKASAPQLHFAFFSFIMA